jgi:acyl transferase domain-containing protein
VRLHGSAVRQDGKSASLTAPNGSAQFVLISQAMDRAATKPAQVDHGVSIALVSMVASRLGTWRELRLECLPVGQVASIEAHGTGTALGDPTEAGALKQCFGDCHEAPKTIGASKASMGHSEPVAGHIGTLHAMRSLSHQVLAANAQLRILNRLLLGLLRSSEAGLLLPVQGVKDHGKQRLGGVSSFGYSGTIVHAMFSLQSLRLAAGEVELRRPCASPPPFAYRRHAFWWQVALAATTRRAAT